MIDDELHDAFLDGLLDLCESMSREEKVCIANPSKAKSLKYAHDLFLTIQRGSGMECNVDVKYRYTTQSATITAVIPALYLGEPWAFSLAIADASNVKITPTKDGNLLVTMHYWEYFNKIA